MEEREFVRIAVSPAIRQRVREKVEVETFGKMENKENKVRKPRYIRVTRLSKKELTEKEKKKDEKGDLEGNNKRVQGV